MASLALEVAQLEALKAAFAYTPAGRRARQRLLVAKAGQKAKVAAGRRVRRGARSYLDPMVALPLGTPAVETMREAAKVPVANPALWPEHAPASGCREMRSCAGIHALRQEKDAYEATVVYGLPTTAWEKAAYYKVTHSPLPTW